MAFNIDQFRDAPGAPKAEVYPDFTFGAIDFEIAAGSSRFVQHDVDPGAIAIGTLSLNWNIQARQIMAFSIGTSLAAGGVFEILLSHDGTTFEHWRSFFIHGDGNPEGRGGIELFGWQARFVLINSSSVAANTFTGHIQLKGM